MDVLIHHRYKLVLAGNTLDLLSQAIDEPATGLLGTALIWGYIAGQWLRIRRHTPLLCDYCRNLPVGDIQRRDWALRLTHQLSARMRRGFALFGVIIALFAADAITGIPLGPLIAWPVIVAVDWAATYHERVIPWCPYCRDWERGQTGHPTPEPEGVKTA